MLNHLHANFLEAAAFAPPARLSPAELARLIATRRFPQASYYLQGGIRLQGFFGAHLDETRYAFHLRGHLLWAEALARDGLGSEAKARGHFESRYALARQGFLRSALGAELAEYVALPEKLAGISADDTWAHFLRGTYGTCTTDGQPETIFLKQALVLIVEDLTQTAPETMLGEARAALAKAVARLSEVASNFAPRERAKSSRRRCIVDVTARDLSG